MSHHKSIFWHVDAKREDDDSYHFANVHFLIGYNQGYLKDYQAMADEVRQVMPDITDEEFLCSKIVQSNVHRGFTALHFNGYLKRKKYKGYTEMKHPWEPDKKTPEPEDVIAMSPLARALTKPSTYHDARATMMEHQTRTIIYWRDELQVTLNVKDNRIKSPEKTTRSCITYSHNEQEAIAYARKDAEMFKNEVLDVVKVEPVYPPKNGKHFANVHMLRSVIGTLKDFKDMHADFRKVFEINDEVHCGMALPEKDTKGEIKGKSMDVAYWSLMTHNAYIKKMTYPDSEVGSDMFYCNT